MDTLKVHDKWCITDSACPKTMLETELIASIQQLTEDLKETRSELDDLKCDIENQTEITFYRYT